MRFHVFFVRRIFRVCLHKIWRGFKHIVRALEQNPFVHKLETFLVFVPPFFSQKSTYLDKNWKLFFSDSPRFNSANRVPGCAQVLSLGTWVVGLIEVENVFINFNHLVHLLMEVDWRGRYGDCASWWITEESWFDVQHVHVCAPAVVLSGQIESSI